MLWNVSPFLVEATESGLVGKGLAANVRTLVKVRRPMQSQVWRAMSVTPVLVKPGRNRDRDAVLDRVACKNQQRFPSGPTMHTNTHHIDTYSKKKNTDLRYACDDWSQDHLGKFFYVIRIFWSSLGRQNKTTSTHTNPAAATLILVEGSASRTLRNEYLQFPGYLIRYGTPPCKQAFQEPLGSCESQVGSLCSWIQESVSCAHCIPQGKCVTGNH